MRIVSQSFATFFFHVFSTPYMAINKEISIGLINEIRSTLATDVLFNDWRSVGSQGKANTKAEERTLGEILCEL